MRNAAGLLGRWRIVVPAVALVALAATWGSKPGSAVLAVVAASAAGSVLAAVHHAEVVAHRVGEPFGALDPRRRGDGDRGRADRDADGVG